MSPARVVIRTVLRRIWSLREPDSDELRYAAAVSIWVRWVFIVACIVEANYRVEFGAIGHIVITTYFIGMMVPNAYVQWRIRSLGRVEPLWLLALSAIDAATLTGSMSISGGFDSRYFAMYYFALALFAWVFTSPYLVFSWITIVAVAYVSVCLVAGDGIDFGQQEEKELFYRLLAMYGVAVSVNLITRFERVRRLKAVEREREMNRQRIEMSQTIHDTTAQSAYMLGLGLQDAMERTEEYDAELSRKLEALWVLSRSTMWTLRHPIDGGQIFSGRKLSEVLAAHVDTFTVITSLPAELHQHGEEPELSMITRSLLFSIAHNALTNTFRHSGAEQVAVSLQFDANHLLMSVSDDGTGLPENYATRGHGFRNMREDADRLGGKLAVESSADGTTISCTVSYNSDEGGR